MLKEPMEELAEAEQQIKFLETINKLLESKTKSLEEAKKELEKRIKDSAISAVEKEQEQKLLEYINKKRLKIQATIQRDIKANQSIEVLDLFRIFKQMNTSLLQAITRKNHDEIKSILSDLEKEEKIISLGQKQDPTCSECSSVLLMPLFVCPSCNSANFENERLIEHYSCGNVSSEKSYEDDTCPTCKKKIEAFGVDYKVYENHHFCNDCANKFPTPTILLTCRNCSTTHTTEKVKFTKSTSYKLTL